MAADPKVNARNSGTRSTPQFSGPALRRGRVERVKSKPTVRRKSADTSTGTAVSRRRERNRSALEAAKRRTR